LRKRDRTLTYKKLTGFMASFIYLGFLDTLSLDPSLFPILWFLDTRLPLVQGSIKPDFQLFELLSTSFGVA
jgi:hypothetical protein